MFFKNKISGAIGEFELYQGEEWEELTQEELNNHLLNIIKNKKLEELNNYYSSDECWMFKVVYNNSSLTKTCDWFGRMIPACSGQKIMLFTDSGKPVLVNLSEEMAKKLNYKIQVEISFFVKQKKFECEKIINSATVEELENLDIKSFLGEVPRVVDLNSL